VDTGDAVGAFLDHWRPGLAVLVVSELWPNLGVETAPRAVPFAHHQARRNTPAAPARVQWRLPSQNRSTQPGRLAGSAPTRAPHVCSAAH
ncbi:MAG: glycosyltransferase N-terminal domain-containing protein, partial [Maricaulaceae bacterium]